MADPDVVADALVEGMAPIIDRLKAIEARLAETEQKALTYAGVHSRAVAYGPNSLVTCDGALWVSIKSTTGDRPGSGADNPWVLVSKARA